MIPGQIADDVAKSLREFIVTGFETNTIPFAGAFEKLVNGNGSGNIGTSDNDAFIKGPYVSINLPFSKQSDALDHFNGFQTEFSPFVHQQKSWDRLRSDRAAKSTIVATGTGSGKTECFLYPLLDHCLRKNKPGIKAIIIYPMNALAGDQAKRFASVIDSAPNLKGKVRVGLFVGGAEQSDQRTMSKKQVITCKNTLRRNPPDILLTNYKMLDYLLMRPRDQSLWAHNEPGDLKYLIVDELHTFDGAQGSDLAMLIRRLKARLKVNTQELICVGTSATLGSDNSMDDLADYASDIFDTHFDRSSIIGEARQSREEFLRPLEYLMLDPGFKIEELDPEYFGGVVEDYLAAQARLFFLGEFELNSDDMQSRRELGIALQKHAFFHNVLMVTRNRPVAFKDILPAIKKMLPPHLKQEADKVLLSMLALLAHARGLLYEGEPLVTLRLQLWARELRRIVAKVGDGSAAYPVSLQFSDDLKAEEDQLYLPAVQCNECHSTAWLSCIESGQTKVEQELRSIYTAFFGNNRNVRVYLPLQSRDQTPPMNGIVKHLCSVCGHIDTDDGPCPSCQGPTRVMVFEPDLNKSVRRGGVPTFVSQRQCPVCQASNSLLLFGSRASSLSSIAIHQLFANPINDDKKLIAFSDSVQDAAHRAGFFAARTWQHNIRMAIAKAVTHFTQTNDKPIPLRRLFTYLPEFWLEDDRAETSTFDHDRLLALDYITQFIAPNMQTQADYLTLKETNDLRKPANMIGQINKRLVWEILSEFGMKSLIGRSLERTGIATLCWDPSLISNAADQLAAHSKEQFGHELTQKQARHLLWGITLRMKRQGSIYDPLFDRYLNSGGDRFYLNRRNLSFMPDIGKFGTVPKFPGSAHENQLDPVIPDAKNTWYGRWAQQCLGSTIYPEDLIRTLLPQCMAVLVKCGLLGTTQTNKENTAWSLNPDVLLITTELSSIQARVDNKPDDETTDRPSSHYFGSWFVPKIWHEHLIGLPSLDHFQAKEQVPVSYVDNIAPRTSMYKEFFLNGEIKRVIGHEHTALLERNYREALENRFMAKPKQRHPWYENLLSATPTLEMGIDIGDLSSVLLCSVPPSQANYLQRAGRGGRKDGNSFVLTLANGTPHDLYFYADPNRMLDGVVEAPAIFLNASMVLKRQLLAFCFDQWGIKKKDLKAIPSSMQPVLDAVERHDEQKFPFTLLDFIKRNRDTLWEGFEAMLGQKVTTETRTNLRDYLLATSIEDDDPLHVHLLNRINLTVADRKSFQKQQTELEQEIRRIKKKPKDEARDNLELELNRELEGIKRLKTDLNRKKTLNFFTDDGLLPNYAFPEEGTTLHSVVYRRVTSSEPTNDGKTSNFETTVFEYSRPAHAALSELAPDNVFYASNRKVKIDRVEMAGQKNLEFWRLCPSCSHSQNISTTDQDSICPKCGDEMWGDNKQKISMVRLKQVYANVSESEARIGDDSDTREPVFFNRQMLIDFDRSDVVLAYAMKTETRPFGFEFVKKVGFKEINFGKQGSGDQVFNVAGIEMARPGFRLCKECGKVQHRRNAPEHLHKCQFRNLPDASNGDEVDDGIIDCLYLYRHYDSEAIRILLPPLSPIDKEQQIQSFVAALQLGLKTHFGGKVDHLQITLSDEPIPCSTERHFYLVIYDSVPGGTGYLHELLTNPKNLMDMLRSARDVMAACECQDNANLDGCYSCLYAYRNSYGMEQTSRVTALKLLADILDENVELEKVSHLSRKPGQNWADSPLEQRFPAAIEALNNHPALDGARIRISKDIIKGKTGFKLEINDLIYSVETQAELTPSKHGVAYACKPDFLITPDRSEGTIPTIAVFLDGYRYHKDIVHEDMMKRQGILQSSNMLSWSLTWPDVHTQFAGHEVKIPNILRENISHRPREFIDKVSLEKDLEDHQKISELTPLPMLLKFLTIPNLERWRQMAAIRALSWLDQRSMQDNVKKFYEEIPTLPSQFIDRLKSIDLAFATTNTINEPGLRFNSYICGGIEAVKSLDAKDLALICILHVDDPDTKSSQLCWQRLLQYLNIGQFFPNFFAGTKDGIADGNFANLSWGEPKSVRTSSWDNIVKMADKEISNIILKLADFNLEQPEPGYELVDLAGQVIGDAELAWENQKIAFLMAYQLEDNKLAFEALGWTVVTETTEIDKIVMLLGDGQ